MKKLLLFFSLLFVGVQLRADEGMWFLQLIKEQYLADSLRRAGLQLPYDELYSESKPSLRDVVGIFGAGCTGEVISPDGLVLTNNHCGFESVHAMSTMENNYLQDGFFAKSRAEEVPVENLTFQFIVGIEDVTEAVHTFLKREKMSTAEFMMRHASDVGYRWAKESHWKNDMDVTSELYEFYQGNRFYLIYKKTYYDVRLVVNPPQNVAQFGGNSDNWVWPRHNPDFALFRIYASEKGEPRMYDPKNVPLRCKRYLPISLGGVKGGDFSFIMGFPGTTQRYLTPGGLTYLQKTYFPSIAETFQLNMDVLQRAMRASKEDNLALADEYFSLGNTSKNFEGQIAAIDRERLVEKAQQRVAQLEAWARANGRKEYIGVARQADSVYQVYQDSVYDLLLASQAFSALYPIHNTDAGEVLYDLAKHGSYYSDEDLMYLLNRYTLAATIGNPKAFQRQKETAKKLLLHYAKNHRLSESIFPHLRTAKDIHRYVETIYNKTLLKDSLTLKKFTNKISKKRLSEDVLMQHYTQDLEAFSKLRSCHFHLERGKSDFEQTFVKGWLEMHKGRKAPDANSSLRLTYGHVADLRSPKGGFYGYETTLDGLLAKENPRDPDYVVHPRLRELFEAKQFGRYARPDGKLPACFITTNDITGGNSGSPVLNAKGELIGCAFDGNIEGLGGDLEYNMELQRTIAVDIRFVLWVTEIFGGSRYVIDELDIR